MQFYVDPLGSKMNDIGSESLIKGLMLASYIHCMCISRKSMATNHIS